MSKEFSITVPQTNFKIKNDSIYKIIPKLDASAPDGFKDHNSTKVISPDIGNTVHAPFNTDMNVWDTGFYKHSPVYRGVPEEERDIIIKQLQEHIVKPVEAIKGEGILSHQETNTFFDDFKIDLRANRVFNTADPLERLALYLAIVGKELAPKDQQSNPMFGKAQYAIVDNEADMNIRQERELERNRAIGIFYTLSENDRDKLYNILEYLDITNTRVTDTATLNSIFNRWIEDKTSSFQNSKIFIKTYEKFKTDEGEEELYMYKALKDLHSKGLVKEHRGNIVLDTKVLGAGYKQAASALMTSTEDRKKIAELRQQLQ